MKTLLLPFITLLLLSIVIDVQSQIINVPKRVENKVINRVNNKIDRGIDKTLDAAEDEITGKNKTTDPAKPKDPAAGKTDPKSTEKAAAGTKSQDQQSLQAYSNYDFVPGDKVLLFEDFSQDAVGDFPALWTTDVAGEVNTLNVAPGNWFNLNSTEGTYWLMKDIDFPKNFIVEMDIVPKKTGGRFAADLVLFGESSHSEMDKNGDPGTCGLHIKIEKNIWETAGYKKGTNEKLTGSSTNKLVLEEKVNHVIVWVQNRRVRIYHQGGKVIDVPTNIYEGSKFTRLCFKLYRGASCGSYISNIKITNAAPDTRNKLLTEGKLVTYGIYFDVNKDVVKPESFGTLNDIAKILNEVPDVKVKIVGHTDSDGSDAANLDLSKRRAASVKNELVKSFNVKGDRLVTDGMGESQPVAPNDTPSNKALNRRVEFIKM
jgi:OmpA-OmpF porin, OOP family